MNWIAALLLLVLCLLGAAFFAGMETGIVALNRLRLRHMVRQHVRGADVLQKFVSDPDRLLGTTLVGTNLCHTTITVLAVNVFAFLIDEKHAPFAAGVASSLAILILGEYLPKAWMSSFPARRTLPLAKALFFFSLIFGPLGKSLSLLSGWVFRVNKKGGGARNLPLLTRDDVVHLAAETSSLGLIAGHEAQMISGVFGLQTRVCGEIMQPRSKMVFTHFGASTETILEMARRHEVNRMPVYQPETRSFVGIIHVFDVLQDTEAVGRIAADYMQPPQFVNDHTPVDEILPRMRLTDQPMMLVTDSSRAVVGLITLGDVLDEITGTARPH